MIENLCHKVNSYTPPLQDQSSIHLFLLCGLPLFKCSNALGRIQFSSLTGPRLLVCGLPSGIISKNPDVCEGSVPNTSSTVFRNISQVFIISEISWSPSASSNNQESRSNFHPSIVLTSFKNSSTVKDLL